MGEDKSHRGAASQFFVAGELCRRGLVAVLTLGNCPNTDVLVSNKAGTKFAHVQVKTFRPGRDKTVSVGKKAETYYGPTFFWVLAGIPEIESHSSHEYYVVPSAVMSELVSVAYKNWLDAPGKLGQAHNDTSLRSIHLPPHTSVFQNHGLDEYLDRWDLILSVCTEILHGHSHSTDAVGTMGTQRNLLEANAIVQPK